MGVDTQPGKGLSLDPSDGREDVSSISPRVLRGGSFLYFRRSARCADRLGYYPNDWVLNSGFRVGVGSPIFISAL